jgi:hypothetical protein
MEELVQYLEQSALEVDGVKMVPLSAALQATHAAYSMKMTDSLEQVMTELQNSLANLQLPDEE